MDTYNVPTSLDLDPSRSISDYLLEQGKEHPDRVLYEEKAGETWVTHTAAQTLARVEAIAKGFIAAGIGPGERVGIMSRTRLEWTLTDLAAWHAGAVPVPVYETSSAAQAHWILSDAKVKAIVVETAELSQVIEEARQEEDGLPELGEVWEIDGGALDTLAALGAEVSDEDLAARHQALGLDSLATIIYTSGTTGRPKGVELTHGNFVRLAAEAVVDISEVFAQEGARTLLFLPLAHVFARFVEVLVLVAGKPMGHTSDVKQAVADLGTFKPTFILSVPRVWEKVYNSVEQKTGGGVKLKIFRWSAKVGIAYSRALDTPQGPSARLKAMHKVADKLVLSKLRAALGGEARYAVSGGAPLGERLAHFYRAAGLHVLEGYGLTETSAPSHVNRPGDNRIGTVGQPLPGTSARIAEDGEILVKGIGVFGAYHDNEEATAAAIEDGWFHTGDIGSMDKDGFLRITGRKKEIIVTAGGKNVAPAPLEDALRSYTLVSQCVAVGDNKPFIGALVTLDSEMMPGWLKNHDMPEMTVEQAAKDPKIRQHLQMAVDRANSKVSKAEQIKDFTVLTTDFTVENGYLTPSMKVKRSEVLKDFASTIEDFYSQAEKKHSGSK